MAKTSWIECTLADACSEINYGLTAAASNAVGEPKFLRITDIVSGKLDWNTVPYVEADDASMAKYQLRDGDIVIARTGASTGSSVYVKNPPLALFASYLVRLQIKPDFDPRFVSYYLKSELFWEFMRGVLGDKSAQPNASASTMTSAPFRAPRNLLEQQAIAHILGALDDKIELNRQMNQTLEAMARAIFQDWFVDFGPVRAKMEGEEPYLPPDLWNLFPDDMVDSELGEIPEGWDVTPLSKVSNVNPETWSSKNKPDSVEYVDLANTKWGVIESTQHFPWKDAPSRARRVLRPGDTLVGTVRPANGSFCFVGNDGLTGSTGFAVLRPSHPHFRELVYLSATATDNIERLAHLADGAAYPAVRPEIVGETEVTIPTSETEVLAWFSKTVGPILDGMETNKTESRSLAAQREVLLPELTSGKLAVRYEDATAI